MARWFLRHDEEKSEQSSRILEIFYFCGVNPFRPIVSRSGMIQVCDCFGYDHSEWDLSHVKSWILMGYECPLYKQSLFVHKKNAEHRDKHTWCEHGVPPPGYTVVSAGKMGLYARFVFYAI